MTQDYRYEIIVDADVHPGANIIIPGKVQLANPNNLKYGLWVSVPFDQDGKPEVDIRVGYRDQEGEINWEHISEKGTADEFGFARSKNLEEFPCDRIYIEADEPALVRVVAALYEEVDNV